MIPSLTQQQMAELMQETFDRLTKIREAGQKEYAHDESNAFGNFDRIAEGLNLSREKVWLTYFLKHVDGIISHINGHTGQRESIEGRIDDCQVYLELFRGMTRCQTTDPRPSIWKKVKEEADSKFKDRYSVYLAGPMRGRPNFNFDQFACARHFLRHTLDWKVFCPAEHDCEEYGTAYFDSPTGSMDDIPDFDFAAAMNWDLNAIYQSEGIVLLPGWEKSSGARHEKATAELYGRDVYYLHPLYTDPFWAVSSVPYRYAEQEPSNAGTEDASTDRNTEG